MAFTSISALIVMTFLVAVTSFQTSSHRSSYRHTALNMGFMDALNKAMANDPSLPPPVNPGLRYLVIALSHIPLTIAKMIVSLHNETDYLSRLFLNNYWTVFYRSNMPTAVEVQFLPSGKKVKAYLGQNIGMIAKAANVEIKYSCKKGMIYYCITLNMRCRISYGLYDIIPKEAFITYLISFCNSCSIL